MNEEPMVKKEGYWMTLRRAIVTWVLKALLKTLCKIDSREYLEKVRGRSIGGGYFTGMQGPMILAINHVNFLDVPMLACQIYPRYLTGLVKMETWKNPVMGFLMDTYDAIPINRQGAFLEAFRQVKDALKEGAFVAIAPEGKRSETGVLQPGKGGVVELAMITRAPILPMVQFGHEGIWKNMRHLRRTPFRFRVGRPFRFKAEGKPSKVVRERMLEELMGQLAILLPEEQRGIYAEAADKEPQYLEFL
jgi:1-acyl-sn-glycerol-3-phosphate acyltransferase